MIARPLFDLGTIVATPGALAALEANGQSGLEFLARHIVGDWGTVDEHDAAENSFSVPRQLRILSAYELNDATRIWVITEADRSSTCILLPSDY